MRFWNELLLRALATGQAFISGDDERGQTLAEYGIILTIIAVGLVGLALLVFRDALSAAFNTASGCLDGAC